MKMRVLAALVGLSLMVLLIFWMKPDVARKEIDAGKLLHDAVIATSAPEWNRVRVAAAALATAAATVPPAAGSGNPFGAPDREILHKLTTFLASTELPKLSRAETLRTLRDWGFKLREESTENPLTGQRLVARETAPFAGFFNIVVQHAKEEDGKEIFEGLRFSMAPEQESFLAVAEEWRRLPAGLFRSTAQDQQFAIWHRSDGYTMWARQYDEEHPSPRPGLRNAVRVAVELSQE